MAKNNRDNTHLTDYKWKQIEHNIQLLQQRDRRTKNKLQGEKLLNQINFVDWSLLKKNLRKGVYDEDQAQDIYKLVKTSVKTYDNYYKIQTDKESGEIISIQSANPEKQEIYKEVQNFEKSFQNITAGSESDFKNAFNKGVKGKQAKLNASINKGITVGKDPARIDEKVRKLFGGDYDYEDVEYKYDKGERYKSTYIKALHTMAARNKMEGEEFQPILDMAKKLEGKTGLWFQSAYDEDILPDIQDFFGYIKVKDETQPEGYRLAKKLSPSAINIDTFNNLLNDDVIDAIDQINSLNQEKQRVKNRLAKKRQFKNLQKKVQTQKVKQQRTVRPSVTLHKKYGV